MSQAMTDENVPHPVPGGTVTGEDYDDGGRKADEIRGTARRERLAEMDTAAESPLVKFQRVWGDRVSG